MLVGNTAETRFVKCMFYWQQGYVLHKISRKFEGNIAKFFYRLEVGKNNILGDRQYIPINTKINVVATYFYDLSPNCKLQCAIFG